MQALLVLLAIAALSLLASDRRVLDPGRSPAMAQLAASGLLFLALGAVMGPDALGVFSNRDLTALRPLLALGLGVAGVTVGLNLEPRLLRLLPRTVYVAALAHSGTAFLWVALPLAGPLLLTTGLPARAVVGAAALLGAAASLSSGHFAVLGYRSGRMERRQGLSVALLTMLDDLVGLGVLMVALTFGAASHPQEGLGLVALALLLGAVCGGLLAFLMHGLNDLGEVLAVLLGGVALVSGASAYLRVSTLLAGVACGATLMWVGGRAVNQAVRVLGRFERPAYLLLIFLVGAHVHMRDVLAWALLPAYLGLRFLGKVLGGALARRIAGLALGLPPRLGYALIAQGGLALCLVVEYLVLVPGQLSQRVFDVVVAGAVINELLGNRAFQLVITPPSQGRRDGGGMP
ncbi:sodium:proton exchanger [Melittangium boletus]|uniref:Na+/H+ antiporter n=1 Tax=Melittangium boletus DSM 14713 TaxID=1294270 RepID=A0A250IRR0_9BACT|nr:sodium:proton exchanger [Melittangium boletus]ATB33968.1 Na+/H+ antiporter [Melittangium boletus DSM 14713]